MRSVADFFRKPKKEHHFLRERDNIKAVAREMVSTEHENANLAEDGRPWNHFDTKAQTFFSSAEFGKIASLEEVKTWLDAYRNALPENERTLFSVDVCGQLSLAKDLGIDERLALTLTNADSNLRPENEHDHYVFGDMLKTHIRTDFFTKIQEISKARKTGLDVVFFRPVGGLGETARSEFMHLYLYEYYFRPLYEQLRDGGRMFVAAPSLVMMQFLSTILQSVPGIQFKTDDEKKYYMITKSGSELPDIRTVLERFPQFESEFKVRTYGKPFK
ncbi:MAG: hypothetical protein RI911_341 [Candidatus Parcubacteria bacterium]|jgi:hypothetical protein